MSLTKKIILGVFTFLPLIFFCVYIFEFFTLFFDTTQSNYNSENGANLVAGRMATLFLWLILMAICGISITIYYLIHANRNVQFDSNQRLIWILILILAGGIGNIVYYFVEILPKKKELADYYQNAS